MKKIILFMTLTLMFCSVVMAADEPYTIRYIKGYIEDDIQNRVDEDGGTFNGNPGDDLDLQVKLENEGDIYDGEIDIKLTGTLQDIDEGDDIEKQFDWYPLAVGEDETKTLSYMIPHDVYPDEYTLELLINYRYENDTIIVDELNFEVDIEEEEEENTENLDRYFDAINDTMITCNNLANNMSGCWGYIDELQTKDTELAACKEERGTYKTNSDNADENLNNCKNNLREKEEELNVCKIEKTTAEDNLADKISNEACNNKIAAAEEKKDEDMQQVWLILGGIGIGGFILYQKKKKDKSVAGANDYSQDFRR